MLLAVALLPAGQLTVQQLQLPPLLLCGLTPPLLVLVVQLPLLIQLLVLLSQSGPPAVMHLLTVEQSSLRLLPLTAAVAAGGAFEGGWSESAVVIILF